MKSIHWIVCMSISIAAGCGVDGPPYDLEVTHSAATTGVNLHVGLAQADNTKVIVDEWAPIDRGSVDVTYGAILAQGVSYRVYVFEDLDGNNRCDPTDRVWHRDVGMVTGAVKVDLGTLALEPAACSYFTAQ